MKKAKLLALILAFIMLIPLVASCNDSLDVTGPSTTESTPSQSVEEKPEESTTTGNSNVITPPQNNNVLVEDNLDDSNIDYNNNDFNLLVWKQSTAEYDFEDIPEDDVSLALYNRNRRVEERLGVVLKYNEIDGGSSALNSFVETAYSSISINAKKYDSIAAYTRCAGMLALKGAYTDLSFGIEGLDLDMPWWPEDITATNTVADKLYFVTGDIATSLIYQMLMLVINSDYAMELGYDISEIQSDALLGNWTIDAMLTLAQNAYLDNDNVSGVSSDDRFGIYVKGLNSLDLFYMGAGLKYVESSEKNGLEISSTYAGQTSIDILKKFAKATTEKYFRYDSADVITKGNSLIYIVTGASLSTTLRDASFTYAILPAPKYVSTQEYYTAVGFPHSLYSIPSDARDKDMSGNVLECMASESYRQVTPILFEKCFKHKFASTDLDSQILSLIRDRTTFDVGRTFFEELGGNTNSPTILWRKLASNASDKIRGHYNQNQERWNKILHDNIYAIIDALD